MKPLVVVSLASCQLMMGCQSGETVTLGGTAPLASSGGSAASSGGTAALGGSGGVSAIEPALLPLRFSTPEVVTALSSLEKDDNPTLSADQLLICFTSERDGGTGDVDVWCAERTDPTEEFGAPTEIAIINTPGFETSAAIDLDGLTLWFGAEKDEGAGGTDIYRTTRNARDQPWSASTNVTELNTAEDDIPRPTAMNGTVMPMGSRRDSGIYWTYFAERNGSVGTFSPPSLVAELTPDGIGVVDAQLSEDGLLLLFTTASSADVPGSLYAAERTSLTGPFSEPVEIEGVNTEFDDRDPWLSPDGQTLYFSSDRSGDFEIYRATRLP